jgi:hypothetical protein
MIMATCEDPDCPCGGKALTTREVEGSLTLIAKGIIDKMLCTRQVTHRVAIARARAEEEAELARVRKIAAEPDGLKPKRKKALPSDEITILEAAKLLGITEDEMRQVMKARILESRMGKGHQRAIKKSSLIILVDIATSSHPQADLISYRIRQKVKARAVEILTAINTAPSK